MDERSGRSVVRTGSSYKIHNTPIPNVDALDAFKYLSVSVSPTSPSGLTTSDEPLSNRTKNAYSSGNMVLREADRLITRHLKTYYHLNVHTPDSLIHASVSDGGLGIMELRKAIPRIFLGRLVKLLNKNKDSVLSLVLHSNRVRTLMGKLSTMAGEVPESTFWRNQIASGPLSKGLEQAAEDTASRLWISEKPSGWSGRDHVRAVQLRTGNLPTKAIPSVSVGQRRCRHGCACDESISHVLQMCPLTHADRIRRHDEVVKKVARHSPYAVGRWKSSHTFAVGGAIVIADVQVSWDSKSLTVPYERKRAKYDVPQFHQAAQHAWPDSSGRATSLRKFGCQVGVVDPCYLYEVSMGKSTQPPTLKGLKRVAVVETSFGRRVGFSDARAKPQQGKVVGACHPYTFIGMACDTSNGASDLEEHGSLPPRTRPGTNGLDNPIGPTGADHAMDMDSEDEAGAHGPPADNAHLTSGEPIEIILMLPFQSRSCGICLNAGKGRKEQHYAMRPIVSEEENLSYHRNIEMTFTEGPCKKQKTDAEPSQVGWKFSTAKIEKCIKVLKGKVKDIPYEIATEPENFLNLMKETCNEVLGPKKDLNSRKPVNWWTEDISILRKECQRKKRTSTRLNKNNKKSEKEKEEACLEYKKARKELYKAIRKSKAEQWKLTCNELENDIWANAYKIVRKKIKANVSGQLSDAAKLEIAKDLFPPGRALEETFIQVEEEEIELFTRDELNIASKKIKRKKAPGPDGFSSELVKNITEQLPQVFLSRWYGLWKTPSYKDLHTVVKQGTAEVTLSLQRGVKQGDPLSPFLFNAVFEPLLLQLENHPGYKVGGELASVSCMAFVDDIFLLAANVPQACILLRVTEDYLEGLGMRISAPKCTSFEIRPTKDSWYVAYPGLTLIKGERIPVAAVDAVFSYLGVEIFPWAGITSEGIERDWCGTLHRVQRLASKPYQKLKLISRYLVPHFPYTLVAGLRFRDSQDRIMQALWLASGMSSRLNTLAKATRVQPWPPNNIKDLDRHKVAKKKEELAKWASLTSQGKSVKFFASRTANAD
ncbi:hypothetical protein TcasGA2_TC034965 [Tribolium castaneum]|uniref:Reverse transcriptase domain-containing protein n=1 Tax=Tribolium castaneum TaxID=7070 RepID=A0A139W9Q3_TRICA|nr:hypothetical protein TcasGA2_TC034965 [Tribolium castaneum]